MVAGGTGSAWRCQHRRRARERGCKEQLKPAARGPRLVVARALRQEVRLAAVAPAVQQRLGAAGLLDLGQHARVDAVEHARHACARAGRRGAGFAQRPAPACARRRLLIGLAAWGRPGPPGQARCKHARASWRPPKELRAPAAAQLCYIGSCMHPACLHSACPKLQHPIFGSPAHARGRAGRRGRAPKKMVGRSSPMSSTSLRGSPWK